MKQRNLEMQYKKKAVGVISRWEKTTAYSDKDLFEVHMKFRKYKYNIDLLNRSALRIQHSFFKWRAGFTQILSQKDRLELMKDK